MHPKHTHHYVKAFTTIFALSWQINKQKVCENNNLLAKVKIFLKYQAQGRVLTPNPPLRTPLVMFIKVWSFLVCISKYSVASYALWSLYLIFSLMQMKPYLA